MLSAFAEILTESCLDILKTLPILLAVYALLYYIENKLRATPALLSKTAQFGPVCGALAGSIPQCGFSAAASALFLDGYLAPATLVAVFLATSDEAVPVLLSGENGLAVVVQLIVVKCIVAVVCGYLLRLTVYRDHPHFDEPLEIEVEDCSCCGPNPISGILGRTLKTAALLFVILLVMNGLIEGIGTARLSALLLGGSILQPVLCAVIGLIPSCAISVLLSELYLGGAIGFGSLIAGLSTGAGFGYMILLSDKERRPRSLRVIAATFLCAAVSGVLVQLFLG